MNPAPPPSSKRGAPPIEELRSLLGAARVLTSAEDLTVYGYDATAALNQTPGCVVFPEKTEEVSQILKLASAADCPVVTRGSGTGLSGGSLPVPGCIVLCMLRMNRVLEVDRRNLTLLVEPGVITKTVAEEAAKIGLFYPPDPGSLKISTIGGNVAENAGGLRGLKYGVTRDYVMGLEVVLASGEVCWFGGKCVKDVAGYTMRDLFIGSEGTLGVVTKVMLALVPKPAARSTLLATFDKIEAAADTVSAIIEARIIPCTLEFLDRTTIACVEDYAKVGLPLGAAAILLMETDGHPSVVTDEANRMAEIARANGARDVKVARDEAEGERLATARRSAFSALARLRPTTILEDVTVPRSELAKMVRAVEDVAKKHKVQIATFGHMGDGNLHPTIVTNECDAAEMVRVHAALGEIVDRALALGGTITGEHGVGLAKKPYLPRQMKGGELGAMRAVKRALDPRGILNPGKIFDQENSSGSGKR